MHDMLRMMDVASALRRERESAEAQLDLDAHKGKLRERLLATAEASGEALTEAEVDASIQQYFDQQHRYVDPPSGWSRFWANAWVARNRWLLAALLLAIVVFGSLALAHLLSKPTPKSEPSTTAPAPVTSSKSAPSQPDAGRSDRGDSVVKQRFAKFEKAVAVARAIAATDDARGRVDAIASNGAVAHAGEDAVALAAATSQILELSKRLNLHYAVRIVDQPNERSGVFRNFDGKLSGHYLIVEAITEAGQSILREVENSETGRRQRVRKWGEQVPESVYNRVGNDKRTDGVIDQRVFARKRRGHYDEQIVFEDDRGNQLKRGRTITAW